MRWWKQLLLRIRAQRQLARVYTVEDFLLELRGELDDKEPVEGDQSDD